MPSPTPSAPFADPVGLHHATPNAANVCLACLGQGKPPPTSRKNVRVTCAPCAGKGWVSR